MEQTTGVWVISGGRPELEISTKLNGMMVDILKRQSVTNTVSVLIDSCLAFKHNM